MKIFNNILVAILLFSTYSCSDERYKYELNYDSHLSKISVQYSLNINEYNCQDMLYQDPIIINYNLVKEKKLKYTLPDDGMYCLGKSVIFDNPLYFHFLTSNPKERDYLNKDQLVIIYASLQESDSTFTSVKVFEHHILKPYNASLYSYLIENYLIIIKEIDYSYDFIVDGESQIEYSYNIVEITPEGKLKVLDKDTGVEIFNGLDFNNRAQEITGLKRGVYYNKK